MDSKSSSSTTGSSQYASSPDSKDSSASSTGSFANIKVDGKHLRVEVPSITTEQEIEVGKKRKADSDWIPAKRTPNKFSPIPPERSSPPVIVSASSTPMKKKHTQVLPPPPTSKEADRRQPNFTCLRHGKIGQKCPTNCPGYKSYSMAASSGFSQQQP